jgi:arsenate reductase
MVFANTDKEITLIYNSTEHVGQQILAYAQLEKITIRTVDLVHEKITPTQWAEFASRLDIPVVDLINTTSPGFEKKFGITEHSSENDWLTLLVKNPDKLKAPIVMKGDKIKMMNNPQEMLYFTK